jgi:antitoxin ParD1/3/4
MKPGIAGLFCEDGSCDIGSEQEAKMASITISLPDAAKDWIDEQVRSGGYANAAEYVSELVTQERVRQGEELSLEEVRHLIKASKASGIGTRSMDELFAEAERLVEAKKARRA